MKLGEVKIMQIILTCSVLCLGLVYRLVTSFFESTRHPDMFATGYCRPLITSKTYYDLKKLFKNDSKGPRNLQKIILQAILVGISCVLRMPSRGHWSENPAEVKHWLIEKNSAAQLAYRRMLILDVHELPWTSKRFQIFKGGFHHGKWISWYH